MTKRLPIDVQNAVRADDKRRSGWRIANWIVVSCMAVAAALSIGPYGRITADALWIGGIGVILLGSLTLLRTPAYLVFGIACAMAAFQWLLLTTLFSEVPGGGLAMGVLTAIVLPSMAAGAVVAACVLPRLRISRRAVGAALAFATTLMPVALMWVAMLLLA